MKYLEGAPEWCETASNLLLRKAISQSHKCSVEEGGLLEFRPTNGGKVLHESHEDLEGHESPGIHLSETRHEGKHCRRSLQEKYPREEAAGAAGKTLHFNY